MEQIQIVFLDRERREPVWTIFQTPVQIKDRGWAYRVVMALTNFEFFIGSLRIRQVRREDRRLAAKINQAIEDYSRPAIILEKPTADRGLCWSASVLLQNGWRIRALPGGRIFLTESN